MQRFFDDDSWRKMTPDLKELALSRLRVHAASLGHAQGHDPSPGAMATRLDPLFVMRPHLQVIDDALVRLHTGETDRLAVSTPPQIGKSTLAGEWFVAWWLSKHPTDRVIVGTYADALARKRGRQIRGLVNQHGNPWGLAINKESRATLDWMTTSGAGVRCAGVGAGITGMPADMGVVDDPHKDRAEADSLTIRENVWDWYSSTFNSRLSPGAPVVVIMTRWHPDDMIGRLLKQEGRRSEGGRWDVVHLPALAGPGDILGRTVGAPLTHPKIEVFDVAGALAHWEEKRRTSRPRDWSALYQCDPMQREGAIITEEVFDRQYVPHEAAEPAIVAVAVDPSGGGRDEAGVVGGYLSSGKHCYWTHDRSGVMSADQWGRAACELAAEIGADRIIVEKNYGADMARLAIRTSWDALAREWAGSEEDAQEGSESPYAGQCPRIVLVNAKRGKYLRAEPVAQQLTEGRVWLTAHMPDLVDEWLTWRPADTGHSPGRIDASVYLTLELLRPPGYDTVMSVPEGPLAPTRDPMPGAPRIERR